MQQAVMKLLWGTALLGCSALAGAQEGGTATQYGKIGGMNAGNAQACGATAAQVARLREQHKASIRQIFGSEPGFDKDYDAAAAASEQKIVQAWKKGQYRPAPEVCNELKRQVGA